MDGIATLRRLVVDDPVAIARLTAASDAGTEAFVEEVTNLAAELGLAIAPDAVHEAMRAARAARLERWI